MGFSLVEVTLALGVGAFCLIAIFGLLPSGMMSKQTALEQTAANGILSAVAADLRATRPQTQQEASGGRPVASAQFPLSIPSNPVPPAQAATTLYFTSERNCTTALGADSRYRLTITFPPNGPNPRAATFVNLQASWPARVAPAKAAGSVTTFIALDRN